MKKKRVLIISSANMDLMMKVKSIPERGQTVIDNEYDFVPGGKGANAALAFAKLGADCYFCARLGDDENGRILKEFYKESDINTDYIYIDSENPTGLAVVIVESDGSNRIVVYPGANSKLSVDDAKKALECEPDAIFLQFEAADFDTAVQFTSLAKQKGIPIYLDAAPADSSYELSRLAELEVFSPNETETQIFTGINPDSEDNCLNACRKFGEMLSFKYCVLKLGSRGAYVYDGNCGTLYPPYPTKAVDTTAAGDAFTAAFTIKHLETGDVKSACDFANKVGAYTVSKKGASSSIPTLDELEKFLNSD